MRAHAFDHFLRLVNAKNSGLSAVRVEVGGVPRAASYDRGPDLELWEVRAVLEVLEV